MVKNKDVFKKKEKDIVWFCIKIRWFVCLFVMYLEIFWVFFFIL